MGASVTWDSENMGLQPHKGLSGCSNAHTPPLVSTIMKVNGQEKFQCSLLLYKSRRPARDADPQIGQTKSYGYIKLYIWIKITLRCVDSSEIGCILSQWNQTFAIYMTKIQKWKQERCVAIRFFLSNLRIPIPSLVSVTGIAVFGHPDVSWDRDFFMKIFLKWKFDHMYLLTRVFFQCKWGFTDATFFEESLLVLCNESEIIHLHLSFFRAMLTLFRCLAEATAFLGMFELDFEEAEFDSNLNSFWSEFLF